MYETLSDRFSTRVCSRLHTIGVHTLASILTPGAQSLNVPAKNSHLTPPKQAYVIKIEMKTGTLSKSV